MKEVVDITIVLVFGAAWFCFLFWFIGKVAKSMRERVLTITIDVIPTERVVTGETIEGEYTVVNERVLEDKT